MDYNDSGASITCLLILENDLIIGSLGNCKAMIYRKGEESKEGRV